MPEIGRIQCLHLLHTPKMLLRRGRCLMARVASVSHR
jgi:hypothetical protein